MSNPTRKLSKLQVRLIHFGLANSGVIDSQMAINSIYGIGGDERSHRSRCNTVSTAIGRLAKRGLVRRGLRGQAILEPLVYKVFLRSLTTPQASSRITPPTSDPSPHVPQTPPATAP